MTFKQKIVARYQEVIDNKIASLESTLHDLFESSKNETKSSAGDKFETTRAMLQIEQDNVRKQLKDAQEQKVVFKQINYNLYIGKVMKGSLVKTNKDYLLVSIALSKIVVDELVVIALSPQSPLGIKIMGLKASDKAFINNQEFAIESIE
ncbi:MAG: hypothetical protein JWQ96_593 [Segetibacter sp.]|nr:hypothetical protein [Segetibacter sp.]